MNVFLILAILSCSQTLCFANIFKSELNNNKVLPILSKYLLMNVYTLEYTCVWVFFKTLLI